MPKHDGEQSVLVYSRAFARDEHHLARAFLEAQHEGVHDILTYRPRNDSH